MVAGISMLYAYMFARLFASALANMHRSTAGIDKSFASDTLPLTPPWYGSLELKKDVSISM